MRQGTLTVTDRVRRQHDVIRALFADAGGATEDARAAWATLVRRLALHETAEEVAVYPSAAAIGGEVWAAVQARKAEERAAKVALAELEGMDPASSAFGPALADFQATVEAHAAAEEREVLPALDSRIGRAGLQALDVVFVSIQLIGPTHAHRFAPVGALGNLAVGPVVGAVDRTRDLLRR
jgi:hypothetical protein